MLGDLDAGCDDCDAEDGVGYVLFRAIEKSCTDKL